MPTRIPRFLLRLAARELRAGGTVAYPTESVFGLGCDPLNQDAVQRILAIKQRPASKGLIVIASDFRQLRPFVHSPEPAMLARVQATWPGPHTWLLPANPACPVWLTGYHDTLAVRVTAHPLAAALCVEFGGPIVSTSANLAGRNPAYTALGVRLRCPGVDRILPGRCDPTARPTTIRDAATGALIRAG